MGSENYFIDAGKSGQYGGGTVSLERSGRQAAKKYSDPLFQMSCAMELTLFYRGVLASNGGTAEKQSLRRVFHRQLAEFWKQNPLDDYRHL